MFISNLRQENKTKHMVQYTMFFWHGWFYDTVHLNFADENFLALHLLDSNFIDPLLDENT